MRKSIYTILLLTILAGCGAIKSFLGVTVPNTVNKTEALLEDAIRKITEQSESWQTTLQDLENKLVEDAQSTVRNEVQNLASRTIAVAGSEFRCNTDFLANRVIQELKRIKARLLNKPIPVRDPALCQVVPTTIDMSLDPDRRNKIDLTGYDFDNQPNLKLFVYNGSQKLDVSSALNRLTHYHMTINLGNNGVVLNQTSNKIVLEYDNKEFSSIAVTQPQLPNCTTKVDHTYPEKLTLMPPHTRGDTEFKGHGPRVTSDVRISIANNTIKATVYMKAEETQGDWTTAEGSKTVTIYTPPSGYQIISIDSDTYSTQSYTDSNKTDDYFSQGTGELINRFVFVGDTDGDEAGSRTKVDVFFNKVTVKLKQVADCRN